MCGEAVLYPVRVGSPWRDLPADCGKWDTVSQRFRTWEHQGLWAALWRRVQPGSGEAKLWAALSVDSTRLMGDTGISLRSFILRIRQRTFLYKVEFSNVSYGQEGSPRASKEGIFVQLIKLQRCLVMSLLAFFCDVDGFCQEFKLEWQRKQLCTAQVRWQVPSFHQQNDDDPDSISSEPLAVRSVSRSALSPYMDHHAPYGRKGTSDNRPGR